MTSSASRIRSTGREVVCGAGWPRDPGIFVEPARVSDDEAVVLARDVARKIENEMTYPGQIKVTVIREMRASELAKQTASVAPCRAGDGAVASYPPRMRLLFLGDVVGKSARQALRRRLRALRRERDVAFVVANGENAAEARASTPIRPTSCSTPAWTSSRPAITWQHSRLLPVLEHETRIIRPANFPEGNPGRGFTVQRAANGVSVAVVNLIGRVFMGSFDCPFRARWIGFSRRWRRGRRRARRHARRDDVGEGRDGWHLAGRVAGVVGSHTHVQTAGRPRSAGGPPT